MINSNGVRVAPEELYPMIMTADEDEIEAILNAVILRHVELHPKWDEPPKMTGSIRDINEQLDKVIALLEIMSGKTPRLRTELFPPAKAGAEGNG